MTRKIWFLAIIVSSLALAASAVDFGGHIGYYGSNVQKAAVGVNVQVPFGMIAISPNLDYSRNHGVGLWLGAADVALRFQPAKTEYWVGAGPTYGYLSSYGSSSRGYDLPRSAQQYGGGGGGGTGGGTGGGSGSGGGSSSGSGSHTGFQQFTPGSNSDWGWDVNAGVALGIGASYRPYAVVRYNRVRNLKTTGVAIGLRFGH